MKDESGLVALIATIIFGLLTSVIAVGSVALQVNEQRQATDADASVRAYFAADAGVEDALLKVKKNLPVLIATGGQNSCYKDDLENAAPPSPGDQPDTIGYTCQTIRVQTNAPEGTLAREQTVQFDLTGVAFTDMVVRWHQNGTDQAFATAPGGPTPPSPGTWPYPAAMEVMDINFGNVVSAGDVNVSNTILFPQRPGGASIGAISSPRYSAGCNNSGSGYACEFRLTGFSAAANHIIRMRPRYVGTHYQVQFLAGGVPITIPDQYATVDVTGKSGQVFRRIVAKVPIKNGVASGLDYVLFADDSICKDFRVRDSLSGGKGLAQDQGCGTGSFFP